MTQFKSFKSQQKDIDQLIAEYNTAKRDEPSPERSERLKMIEQKLWKIYDFAVQDGFEDEGEPDMIDAVDVKVCNGHCLIEFCGRVIMQTNDFKSLYWQPLEVLRNMEVRDSDIEFAKRYYQQEQERARMGIEGAEAEARKCALRLNRVYELALYENGRRPRWLDTAQIILKDNGQAKLKYGGLDIAEIKNINSIKVAFTRMEFKAAQQEYGELKAAFVSSHRFLRRQRLIYPDKFQDMMQEGCVAMERAFEECIHKLIGHGCFLSTQGNTYQGEAEMVVNSDGSVDILLGDIEFQRVSTITSLTSLWQEFQNATELEAYSS